ncbi:MAG: ABC transporter permease [Hyphomonadaceae bacterium]|nr:ABC transporter permease [Hyphomonadaceae bacterium]
MASIVRQISAVIAMTIGGPRSRFWGSITTILSIALVVATLLAFLAMSDGFAKTVAGTGSDDIAMILGTGSEAELNSTMSSEAVRLLEESPGFARDASGRSITSPELYVVVGANRRAGGGEANVSLRGVTPRAPDLRPGFRFSSGRMSEPGTTEDDRGSRRQREFKGFDLNSELQLGGSAWTVVGVFEVPGTVFDSELWADLPVVQSLFNRGPSVQALRARLESPASLVEVKAFVASEPRLRVDVKTEKEHFAGEAQSSSISSILAGRFPSHWALAHSLVRLTRCMRLSKHAVRNWRRFVLSASAASRPSWEPSQSLWCWLFQAALSAPAPRTCSSTD